MRTDIIETEVSGHRIGLRERITTYTHTKRYDYFDGNNHYKYSGNETTGSIFRNQTPVELAVVPIGAEKTVSFDPHHLTMPRKGDPVHVLVHRIGGATVYDLYEDRSKMITVDGDFPFAEPTKTWGIVLALVGTVALIALGHEPWWSMQRAGIAGIALFLLNHAHDQYVKKGLALLRWKAARRVTKALGAR